MPLFKYNKENQTKFTPNAFEPFLRNVPKEKLYTLPTDKTSEDNRIRFLPPWSAEGLFAKVTQLHFNVGINRNTFVCSNPVEEGSCPFCDVVAKLRGEYEKNKADITAAGAKTRAYSNILDVKRPNLGVMVYSYGSKIFFPVKRMQDSGEYGDITDPIEGRDIIINRVVSGKNMFTDSVFPTGKSSPIGNPEALDELFDLDTILPEIDMDLVHRAFKSHPWKVYDAPVTSFGGHSFKSEPKEEQSAKSASTGQEANPVAAAVAEDKMELLKKKLQAMKDKQ